MKLTDKSTKDLIPYIGNSRTHSDEQITQVASSIKEFGFTNPILIDESNGIIAGHGRLMAAKKLGLDSVPCIVLEGLTEAQKKAYVIADNQLALNSGWDLDTLKLELDHLKEVDFDIDLLGFDDGFFDNLEEFVDFSDKNKELNMDDFDDWMELKLKFSSDQYEAVKVALSKLGESPEIALLQALGL
jgi:ParB-like chromosome segregation protein Spo0J